MKPDGVDRRDFLKRSAATAAALAVLPSLGLGQTGGQAKPLRLGFIGVGGRGTVLLRFALMIDGVEIPAICDIDESHLGRAQRLVERRGYPTPAGYSRGPEDYRRMFEERHDLDAVICATPREWHAPMMVAAMEAGVWAGVEVPAAISVDECWQLVETSERT
ncbi:MAG: Gfo/Idh/MocA family oxidoreductase, partial [Candidatus Glassbacteria bacterium]